MPYDPYHSMWKDKSELPEGPRIPVWAILDNIRSAQNVGDIFRSADALLLERLYLVGITAFPPNSKLWKETGFQGYEPANTQTFQPKKKPKGGELTPQEKAQNAAISSERIGVEHIIGGVKVFRIVHHVFRNIKQDFDDLVMETACGLHNLRIDPPMTV